MAQQQARQSPLYFDLTTSWSKDISIFHASLGAALQRARDAGDTRAEALAAGLLAEVDAILRDANDAALVYVQREAGYVRTGSHVARVEGRESGQFREADLVVVSWYQHTSRDGDMQLHTHNQIAHVAFTRHDGKWRAPDSTAYYEHARAAGQVASVHAEAALTRRFGLDWVPRADGMGFGIDGIGADLMGVFSHRRDVINEKVARELVPRFRAEYGRAPNQRELASLMDSRRPGGRVRHFGGHCSGWVSVAVLPRRSGRGRDRLRAPDRGSGHRGYRRCFGSVVLPTWWWRRSQKDAARTMPPLLPKMARAAQPLPEARQAGDLPAERQRELPGGLQLHFHGVTAEDIATILNQRHDS